MFINPNKKREKPQLRKQGCVSSVIQVVQTSSAEEIQSVASTDELQTGQNSNIGVRLTKSDQAISFD